MQFFSYIYWFSIHVFLCEKTQDKLHTDAMVYRGLFILCTVEHLRCSKLQNSRASYEEKVSDDVKWREKKYLFQGYNRNQYDCFGILQKITALNHATQPTKPIRRQCGCQRDGPCLHTSWHIEHLSRAHRTIYSPRTTVVSLTVSCVQFKDISVSLST